MSTNNNMPIDEQYQNRQNRKYGYIWVPDKVVDAFRNERKQGVRLSPFDYLQKYLLELLNNYEKIIGKWEYDFQKKQGASIERVIMWIEHGYPNEKHKINEHKEKFMKWEREGLID